MEKIKKILTDPKLAHYWQELNQEMMCEEVTKYNVTKALKEVGLGKKLMTEYGETYYLMYVIKEVSRSVEGVDFEWVNKDTLEMKECNNGEIYTEKCSILHSLNRLLEFRVISENAAESVKVILDLLDIEEEDDDYDF